MKYSILDKKKKRLDAMRPLNPDLVKNLEEWYQLLSSKADSLISRLQSRLKA